MNQPDSIEIVRRANGHVVRVYATYTEADEAWTVMAFLDSGREVWEVATVESPWEIAIEIAGRALRDAEDAS